MDQTLIHQLPGMVYQCLNQYDRPMVFASEDCKALCGYPRSDLETSRILWGKLIHKEDRDQVWHLTQQAIVAQTDYVIEYRITLQTNETRWVADRGRVSPTDSACLLGFIANISARRQVELIRSEEQAYAEAVVETAVEAIISIDTSGAIETFNAAAQQMFGYSLAEVRGKNVHMLMPEPYHNEHDGYLSHYVTTNVARIIGSGREVSALHKNGTVFPIHLSVGELAHQSKRRFVGLIRDISAQRNAELEARNHREHLAHMDRLKMLGEMAAGIAHEINQPLTAISLFAQAGKRLVEASNYEKLPEVCDKLSQHAQRAGAVIERVQSMGRQQNNVKKQVDCNVLIEEIAKLAESEALLRDITITVRLASKLPQVSVDPIQIQQVALNLLRNGMEAMRSVNCQHGNNIQLQTSLCATGEVEIAVIDSGCGISKDAARSLFTPFLSTKESGMGMGLSISRSIITAHGGQLEFRDNPTEGTTFFFTLPTAQLDEQDG